MQAADLTGHDNFRRRLRESLLDQRGGLARVLALSGLGAAIGIALPYTSTLAIDVALPDASPRVLLAAALGVVLLVVHQAWCGWLQAVAEANVHAAVERSALGQVFSAVVRSEYTALRRQQSGGMATTLASAGTAVGLYVDSLTALTTHGAFAIGYFIVLGNSSLVVAALVVIADLLIAMTSIACASLEAVQTRVLLERTAEQQQLLHSLMSGLSSLRGLFVSRRMGEAFGAKVEQVRERSLRVARIRALQNTLSALGSQGLSTALMIWAVYACFEGALTLGGMMFLISSSASLSASARGLVGVFCSFRGLRPHLERVDQVLSASRESRARADHPLFTRDDIVVDDVAFRYDAESRWVVNGQSLSIQRGELYCLGSPSGSGKTTLLRLLAGLLLPTRGKVSIFGVDAHRARESVLYVPQHCTLFESSIRENLELLSGVSYAEVLPVAELTGLGHMLQGLPMREETMLAAQGHNLSSGQRQLIVLTAAFASPRPVLLFDEATSQVDVGSRARIQWEVLRQGRTIVRVEHG